MENTTSIRKKFGLQKKKKFMKGICRFWQHHIKKLNSIPHKDLKDTMEEILYTDACFQTELNNEYDAVNIIDSLQD